LPILSILGATARAVDNLTGFAPTARWKPLTPTEDIVEEPVRVSETLHAPTIAPEEEKFMPQKHNYPQRFDRQPFSAAVDVPAYFKDGKAKMNRDEKQVFEKASLLEKGRPCPKFLTTKKTKQIQQSSRLVQCLSSCVRQKPQVNQRQQPLLHSHVA